MIEVKSRFDRGLTKSLLKFSMRNLWWVYVLFTVVFIGFGISDIILTDSVAYGIVLIVIGVLFFPMTWLFTIWLQNRLDKSSKMLNAKIGTYYKFGEKIYQETCCDEATMKSTTECNYSLLYKAYETQSHFFIFISKMQAHVLPKCDFTNGTPEELSILLREKMGDKFIVKKNLK